MRKEIDPPKNDMVSESQYYFLAEILQLEIHLNRLEKTPINSSFQHSAKILGIQKNMIQEHLPSIVFFILTHPL